MNIICKAKAFAEKAHKGQVRKYTGEPYISHVISVSNILRELYPKATTEMVVSAILHDTVEDTQVSINDIENNFGKKISEIVGDLTDVSNPCDGNRAERKAIDREHTKNSSYDAQVVKCADLIDNTSSIVKYDMDFARVYLKEKRLLLDAMRGDVKCLEIWLVASSLAVEPSKPL